MLIAQISDPHITAPGKQLYRRIDTAAALQATVLRVVAMQPAPVCVVLSGDLVAHGRAAEYAHLAEILAPLPMPYFLMPGNHDERGELASAFPTQVFSGAPLLCQRVDLDGLSLLLLDTLIVGAEGGEVDDAHLAWLDAACPSERPVILFMHHPPFATGIAGMDAIRCAGADRLDAWLREHRNVVTLACGHVHRAVFSSFAGIPAVIAPSTAHQIAFDLSGDASKLAWTQEPGGFLLHCWDGATLVSHILPRAEQPTTPYAT